MVKNINKKGQGLGAFLVVAGIVGVGIYGYNAGWYGNDIVQTQSIAQTPDSQSFDVYATNVVSSLGTVTSVGVGPDTQYTIEIDKDTLTANSDLQINLTTVQDIPDGVSFDSSMVQPHSIKVPLSSDINVHDAAGDEYILFDSSASRVDGQKDYNKYTYTGVDPVSASVAIKVNPNSFNLSNAVEIDEIGEKETYTLDFGLKNKVVLVIKN